MHIFINCAKIFFTFTTYMHPYEVDNLFGRELQALVINVLLATNKPLNLYEIVDALITPNQIVLDDTSKKQLRKRLYTCLDILQKSDTVQIDARKNGLNTFTNFYFINKPQTNV